MKLTDLVTENDGVSLCPARIIILITCAVMQYKFFISTTTDWSSFATGMALLAGGVAANKFVEHRDGL